jgi:hypothetical protein
MAGGDKNLMMPVGKKWAMRVLAMGHGLGLRNGEKEMICVL